VGAAETGAAPIPSDTGRKLNRHVRKDLLKRTTSNMSLIATVLTKSAVDGADCAGADAANMARPFAANARFIFESCSRFSGNTALRWHITNSTCANGLRAATIRRPRMRTTGIQTLSLAPGLQSNAQNQAQALHVSKSNSREYSPRIQSARKVNVTGQAMALLDKLLHFVLTGL
jgi:hypothetical protein